MRHCLRSWVWSSGFVSLTTHSFFSSRVFAWVLDQSEVLVASLVGAGSETEVCYLALRSFARQFFPYLVTEHDYASELNCPSVARFAPEMPYSPLATANCQGIVFSAAGIFILFDLCRPPWN